MTGKPLPIRILMIMTDSESPEALPLSRSLPFVSGNEASEVSGNHIAQIALREQGSARLVKGDGDKLTTGEFVAGCIVETDKAAETVKDNYGDIQLIIGIADLCLGPCQSGFPFAFWSGGHHEIVFPAPQLLTYNAGRSRFHGVAISGIQPDVIERRPGETCDQLVESPRIVEEQKVSRLWCGDRNSRSCSSATWQRACLSTALAKIK